MAAIREYKVHFFPGRVAFTRCIMILAHEQVVSLSGEFPKPLLQCNTLKNQIKDELRIQS